MHILRSSFFTLPFPYYPSFPYISPHMRLYRHILRSHAGPFLFSFATLMFIFLLQFIMKFIDQLVGKGLDWLIIGELIAFNLAWMVVLAVPMSVLVATLMAFGNMSSANEITAMKASGMSLYRMIAPVVFASLLLTYLLIEFNNKVLPEANFQLKGLLIDIRRKKPTLTISAGLFSQELTGYSILARKTDERSNDLEGVTIYDYSDPVNNVVLTAQRGSVSFTPDFKNVIMDLEAGEIHEINGTDYRAYRRIRFNRHRIVMPAEGFDFERTGAGQFSRSDRELSAQSMQAVVDSLEQLNSETFSKIASIADEQFRASPDRTAPPPPHRPVAGTTDPVMNATVAARSASANINNYLYYVGYNRERINEYLVEIHKKYSIPVACIVFVFIGVPLGIMARRGTFGVAATLSLGFFLLYWASLIGGEKLADRGFIAPWIGMWIANIVLGALGIYLTLRAGRESLLINWDYFRRFVPRSMRKLDAPDAEVTG
jgi:lipopolysaccharide export system permease protein